ncbi:MAG: hypothetical protein ACPH63_01775, partial [Flavobacteriaceae bacterium]
MLKQFFLLLMCFGFVHCSDPTKGNLDFVFSEITISELSSGYDSGKFSIEQVTQTYLNRIENIDQNGPRLRSIIEINPEALSIAQA